MQRDMDLIRRIVLATADLPAETALQALDGVDESEFVIHVIWLTEAGLVKAVTSDGAINASYAHVQRLTWQGCELADAIRSDTLWAKAKTAVIKPSTSFTFDLLRDWLKAELMQGLPTLRTLGQHVA